MRHTIICGSIVASNNSVLMVQEGKERAYEEWNLPTGKIESGESPMECVKREVKEETGLSVNPKQIVGIYVKPGETSDIVLAVIFESEIVSNSNEPSPSDDDILAAEWIPIDSVKSLDLRSSHILPAIEDWKSDQSFRKDIFETIQDKK